MPAINSKLNTTYLLKEQFRFVFTQTSDTDAVWQLVRRIGMAVKSRVSQVERFARGIADKFNEVINGIRYGINSGRIESTNAGIKRIQSKCCGLFDTDDLFVLPQKKQSPKSGCLKIRVTSNLTSDSHKIKAKLALFGTKTSASTASRRFCAEKGAEGGLTG